MSFQEEREAIVGALEYTGKVLEHLIARLGQDIRAEFQDVWYSETKLQLEESIRMLRGEPSDDDTRQRAYELYEARGRGEGHDGEDWDRAQSELREGLRAENGWFRSLLHKAGLAGKSLKLKLSHLAQAATKGLPGQLLNLLNKFLRSLASAVGASEAVTEFKEWLEEQVVNLDQYDPQLASIYIESGDPFQLQKL